MAAAAGFAHSAAVGEDGSLFVWGSGFYGQLGTGDTASRLAPTRVTGLPAPVRQVAAGIHHTGIVTDAGDLLMCGHGEDGRLGLGDENKRATPTLVARTGAQQKLCALVPTEVALDALSRIVDTLVEFYLGTLQQRCTQRAIETEMLLSAGKPHRTSDSGDVGYRRMLPSRSVPRCLASVAYTQRGIDLV